MGNKTEEGYNIYKIARTEVKRKIKNVWTTNQRQIHRKLKKDTLERWGQYFEELTSTILDCNINEVNQLKQDAEEDIILISDEELKETVNNKKTAELLLK